MSKKPNQTSNASRGRRAKRYRLPLSAGSDLHVSLRWFTTSKAHRSKAGKQYVIRVHGFPIKEICITRKRHRRKRYTKVLGFRIGSAALIIVGLSGAAYSSQHLSTPLDLQPVAAAPVAPKRTQTVKHLQPPVLPHSEPTQVQIGKIDLTAPIVGVGLRADSTIDLPGPTLVGWYNQGPAPGERGPAVLVGHVDYLRDIAVFWRLREILPGDNIEIKRADGLTVRFRVDSTQQFNQNNFPTQTVYGPLAYAGIRLITCGGTFDPTTHHYSENTVVFGTMVDSF